MYVETRFGIGAISKPLFVTDIHQHWADMYNIITVCCQYDCLFDISEIVKQYCSDITETLLLHQKRYLLLILELYWADIFTILILRIANVIASL